MSTLVARATDLLRSQGGRMTAQRRAILESLETIGGHPTADDVYAAARGRDATINPSTVYRTLAWLEEAGLLGATWLGHERSKRQDRLPGALPGEHHHFVCTRCGTVIEFRSAAVAAARSAFAAEHGVRVTQASLTLYGLCARCAAQTAIEEE